MFGDDLSYYRKRANEEWWRAAGENTLAVTCPLLERHRPIPSVGFSFRLHGKALGSPQRTPTDLLFFL